MLKNNQHTIHPICIYASNDYCRDTSFKKLDEDVLLNWRAMLDKSHEWYLGSLRGFLVSWNEYGYYGVTTEMVKTLEILTLSGNKKGVSVANRCPDTGAFTNNEVLALNHELIRLFRITISHFNAMHM